MKTAKEWEQEIAKITVKLHKEFPELVKYIQEMPAKVPEKDGEEIKIKNLKEYYNSLEMLIEKYRKTQLVREEKKDADRAEASGYPPYPASDDIYNKGKKAADLKPGDPSKNKAPNEKQGSLNEKDFKDDMSGEDLDVPGSELDDLQERIGSEDEENNYYSLGGDAHNDLEEDRG